MMKGLQRLLQGVGRLAARLRTWPYLGRTAFAVGLLAMMFLASQRHHLENPAEVAGYDVRDGRLIAEAGVPAAGPLLRTVSLLLPYLDTWMLVGGGILLFTLLRQWGNPVKLVFPSWVAGLSVAAWAICADIAQHLGPMQMTELGEPPVLAAYWVKLVMIGLAALCLPTLVNYYVRQGALERYTLRTFFAPLVFCFIAFTSLWMIMDLLDNLKEFQDVGSSARQVLLFYVGIIPYIYVSVMPAALLLAILYTLTRMSRANEIVAMLGSGRSVGQILRPIFAVAVGAALLSTAANYHWAPRAEGNRKAVLRAMGERQKDSIRAYALLHRDPVTRRVWYVGSFPFSLREGRLRSVQVREFDADSRLLRVLHADSATWRPDGRWRFFDGREVRYREGRPALVQPFPGAASANDPAGGVFETRDFTETPWSMVSYALKAESMGVPEMVSYLKTHANDPAEKLADFRAHLHHRFAMPWQSLALALVAAPLGIAWSRRGAVGGIAGSIFLFFGVLFLNNLCLNLAKGGHLPAATAAWIPHAVFGSLGLFLLHLRSQNRDLPRLSLDFLFKRKPALVRPRRRAAA
jgi:LPS export ABC transporter permease LptG